MRAMLHRLAIYRDAQPNAGLLRPLGGPDRRPAAIHNEDMHPRLAIFMRRHGSSAARRRELNVSKGGIAAVVSTVAARAALSSRYRLTRGIEPHH
eukprot:2055927-Prymnesium_polylepis.1